MSWQFYSRYLSKEMKSRIHKNFNIHVNLICNIPKLGWEGAQGNFLG